MKSERLENINEGGELGSAALDTMAKAGIAETNDGVMINSDLLPSKGKYYPGPLYVTELTPIDLKNLNSINEENANQIINTVLSNCIHGVNSKDILQGDKVWLLFYIRSVTYDDFPIFMKYTCPVCKKVDTYKIRMNDLTIKYASDDFEPDIELEGSKQKITLRYPTLKHEDKAKALANNDQIIEAVDEELANVSMYIAKVNGKDVTAMEAYNFVKNMKARDFVQFSKYMIDHNIGLIPVVDIPCSCGEVIQKQIGFTPDFFFPDFKKYGNA